MKPDGTVLEFKPSVSGARCCDAVQRGFQVKECHGNEEFEPLRAVLADAQAGLNITTEDKHVPEVERCALAIRSAHEEVRSRTLRHSGRCPEW
jgi:hypothetical protein